MKKSTYADDVCTSSGSSSSTRSSLKRFHFPLMRFFAAALRAPQISTTVNGKLNDRGRLAWIHDEHSGKFNWSVRRGGLVVVHDMETTSTVDRIGGSSCLLMTNTG